MEVPTAKRKASASPSQPTPAQENVSDSEMDEQLCAHAIEAYNDFVRSFQRRASARIAANRVVLSHQMRSLERQRVKGPRAAILLPYHQAIRHPNLGQTSELPIAPPSEPVRKVTKTIIGDATNAAHVTVFKTAVVLPVIPPTPNANMWTALTANYDVEDEPMLKHLPYFGDDDDEDVVSEFYQLQQKLGTSTAELDHTKEICEGVLQQLQSTWDLTNPDLKRIANAINVEEEEVMIEVYKRMKAARVGRKKHKKNAAPPPSPPNPQEAADAIENGDLRESMEHYFQLYEQSIDSYRTLFCRKCCVYDCDYHGCIGAAKLEITEQNAVAEKAKGKNGLVGTGKNCGNQCFLGQMATTSKFSKARAISTAFGWDSQTRVACARAYFLCSGNFCDVARMLGNKTCLEVAEFCEFYEINDYSLRQQRAGRSTPKNSRKKKNRLSIAHLAANSTGTNEIPSRIKPCVHTGPCDDAKHCSCIEEGMFCSKLCNCIHERCNILFQGCKCLRGRCRTKACPCFASGRECDLDLCYVCCADEIEKVEDKCRAELEKADGRISIAAPNAPPSSTSCQNRGMMAGKTKHVRMARSTREGAGWGLFVDECVRKDEFIIEYVGEMVTHLEAERRGMIYDKNNQSYLFNLDSESVIDSTRKGNKTRFINHSSRPNCYSKIMNVNSDYRIGIYALQEIEPHSELFFDYRYDKEFQHANLIKQPTPKTWME